MKNQFGSAPVSTSPEFEQTVARRALLLGAENLSRILPRLDPTQSQILSRGMDSILRPATRINAQAFQASLHDVPASTPSGPKTP